MSAVGNTSLWYFVMVAHTEPQGNNSLCFHIWSSYHPLPLSHDSEKSSAQWQGSDLALLISFVSETKGQTYQAWPPFSQGSLLTLMTAFVEDPTPVLPGKPRHA